MGGLYYVEPSRPLIGLVICRTQQTSQWVGYIMENPADLNGLVILWRTQQTSQWVILCRTRQTSHWVDYIMENPADLPMGYIM